MSKFYITGVSGTGKSTLARELNNNSDITAFDLDDEDLCHWRNKKTQEEAVYEYGIGKDWLEAHEYTCDQNKLKALLDRQKNHVVVLGVASNQNDFLHLFDKIFLLHCRKETFLHRLNTRGDDNQFAKDKSEQEHLLGWYEDFEAGMLKQGAVPLDAENSTENIVKVIITELGNQGHKPGAPSRRL